MSRITSFRPSGAMVIACLALFVALGGGAYAAKLKLKPNSVKGKTVKDESLTGADIQEATLDGSKIPGIPTGSGADGAGTGAAGGDLAGNYPNPTIKALAVTGAKIAAGAVDTAQLADNGVTNAKLGTNSVTSSKIATATITNNDMANETVRGQEILDGTVATDDIAPTAQTFANDATKSSTTVLTAADAGLLSAQFGVGGIEELPADESNYTLLINGEVTASETGVGSVQVICTLKPLFGANPTIGGGQIAQSVSVDIDINETATLPLTGMTTELTADANNATGGSIACRKAGPGNATVTAGDANILAIPKP